MSEHLTEQKMIAFQQQALPSAELLACDEHLAVCLSCRQRLGEVCFADAGFAALQAEVLSETPPMHLEFEQLADFVDGRLNAEMLLVVNDHLAVCGSCQLAAADLRGFSHVVSGELTHAMQPATESVGELSWWKKQTQAWRTFFGQGWALSFGTAAALVLILGVAWLARRIFFLPAPERTAVVIEPKASPTFTPDATPAATATALPVTEPNLLAQLNDGGTTLALDASGNLQGVETWPPRYRQLVQQSLETARLSRSSALNGLGSASGALMGSPSALTFGLLAPVKQVIATDRPTLRWQPLAGAESYEVEIVNEQYEPVLTSPPLTATTWQLPDALPRGRVYAWQVKALKDGQTFKAPQPPAPLARFRIVGQKEFAEIQTAKARYGNSHLLLGQLYASAGLLDDAEREFRALQQANPSAALPKKLLAEIRQQAAR